MWPGLSASRRPGVGHAQFRAFIFLSGDWNHLFPAWKVAFIAPREDSRARCRVVGTRNPRSHKRKPQFRGQFVAIDVETEDYEVAHDADVASDRLWERRPTAQILVERIGHPAVFHALGMVGRP